MRPVSTRPHHRGNPITATLYEADTRVGGRVWTDRSTFAAGQYVERGGQFIDTSHNATRQLVQELGLSTYNLLRAAPNGTDALYYVNGAPYTVRQARDDYKQIYQRVQRDTSDASYPTTYQTSTARGRQLDATSIDAWIAQHVPGGLASNLGTLLRVAYNIEFGAETNDQSVLNFLYLIGYVGPGKFRIFGKSDEKYAVQGGSDRITQELAARVSGQVQTGRALTALRRNGDGTYRLTLKQGSSTTDITADKVILTVPFSVLRAKVDISQAGFRPRKVQAIQELGMGTNSKLHVQFTDAHWDGIGNNGDTYSDRGYQNTWHETRAQPGTPAVLLNYTGGNVADGLVGANPTQRAQQFLGQVEPVLPGLTPKWNGLASIDSWKDKPWALGSYSYYRVGQYTAFGGIEPEREGNCHFAGEHTTQDYQGYMQGAVVTGGDAAAEVLADLRL